MKEFDSALKTNDLSKIVKFVDDNIEGLSQIEGDRMVLDLETALEESLNAIMDNIFEIDSNGELMSIAGTELFLSRGQG